MHQCGCYKCGPQEKTKNPEMFAIKLKFGVIDLSSSADKLFVSIPYVVKRK